MKNLIFRKNIIANKKAGGAMIVLMLVFFVIFILAFGSGYLVFMNTSKSVDVSNGIKARYAALAGKDRALYEAMKNNYDFAGNCSSNIFQKTLTDGSSYIISCVDNSGDKSFFSTGKYKNVEISLEIDCINIEKDCSDSCKTGSICGGGKLLKTDTYAFSVSPSGCDASGANCSNTFTTADTAAFQWDATVVPVPPAPFECGTTLVDSRDFKEYPTVQIGDKCWTAKNIDYDSGCISGGTCSCYNNDVNNCSVYGKLYEWYTAMNGTTTPKTQGVCPPGWHVPNTAEFDSMSTLLGGDSVSGGSLKQTGTTYWTSPNTGATNTSGFTALPGGYKMFTGGGFSFINQSAYFWTSTNPGSGKAYNRSLNYNNATFVSEWNTSNTYSFSVRCVKDYVDPSDPSLRYNGANNLDNGKVNNNTLNSQANIHLEAVKYCDDLVVNGYSDWYLPATNELAVLRSNSSFPYFNLQSVSGDEYWVSTEQGSTTPAMAGYIKISTAASSNADKGLEFKVRCVRHGGDECSSKTVCGEYCVHESDYYPTVQIGSQCWFAKNLSYLPEVHGNNTTFYNLGISRTPAYGVYGYTGTDVTAAKATTNYKTYGVIYNWYAAMATSTASALAEGTQGICPSGWHVPSSSELLTLYNYLGGSNVAGGKMKQTGTTLWISPNTGATNESGFNGLPGGNRQYNTGVFSGIGVSAGFWSSSYANSYVTIRNLNNTGANFGSSSNFPYSGQSVRCIKN